MWAGGGHLERGFRRRGLLSLHLLPFDCIVLVVGSLTNISVVPARSVLVPAANELFDHEAGAGKSVDLRPEVAERQHFNGFRFSEKVQTPSKSFEDSLNPLNDCRTSSQIRHILEDPTKHPDYFKDIPQSPNIP